MTVKSRGRDAQRSMESRQRTAEKELADLLDQLIAGVRVFQARGQEALDDSDLADRIKRAAKSSAIRLYGQFDVEHGEALGVRADMPAPQVACCGLKVAAKPEDWMALVFAQFIGWNPDLNDGVRLNIRPFMTAEVLRHNKKPKLNITWDKDRGKDVESAPWFKVFEGDRINDHHLTLTEKIAAKGSKP